jgi:putative ABC transport system permease protein
VFRNYLMASLRNLARNRLHAAISIFGLAVGLCGATLAGVLLLSELTYDTFVGDYERVFLAEWTMAPSGHPTTYKVKAPDWVASQMRLSFGEIQSIARIAEQTVGIRRGEIQANENIGWADPNLFDVLALPVAFGSLDGALARPDSVVLSRSAARKFFGRENVIGETLDVDGARPMRVTAITEDLPATTELLRTGILASALATNSPYSIFDPRGAFKRDPESFRFLGRTYLKLKPGASIERLNAAMAEFSSTRFPTWLKDSAPSIELVRLDRVHTFPGLHPDADVRLTVIAVVGVLILIVGCLNFVNLTTARSARRAREVGVRKAAGAGRSSLVAQFLGEALIQVLIAAAIATATAEWLLPHVNAFLDTNATFEYWSNPALAAAMLAGIALVTLLAGAYPAFVLSSFRPAGMLRGQRGQLVEERVRQFLVSMQFAVLIALVIAAGVTWQQLRYATRDILRVPTDQMLVVRGSCDRPFLAGLASLPNVRGAGCAYETFLTGQGSAMAFLPDGTTTALTQSPIEPGLLELFDIKPIAGRLTVERDKAVVSDPRSGTTGRLLINEAAVHRLGFRSAQEAIGKRISGRSFTRDKPNEIVGVVPDFSLAAATDPIQPTVFTLITEQFLANRIFIKLNGQAVPETLAAIDLTWRATGHGEPLDRVFLDAYIQSLYITVERLTQTLLVFSGCAVLLACLGLVGVAAATAERRTKEIGVRKAMGAGTAQLMRLLLWQSARPVLWANLVAWPVAAWVMHRWLAGFAYHVDLQPLWFAAATSVALVLAVATVSAHCYRVAREKPVKALRYE